MLTNSPASLSRQGQLAIPVTPRQPIRKKLGRPNKDPEDVRSVRKFALMTPPEFRRFMMYLDLTGMTESNALRGALLEVMDRAGIPAQVPPANREAAEEDAA